MGLDMYLRSAKRPNTDGVFVAGETYDEEFIERMRSCYNIYYNTQEDARPISKAITDIAVPIKVRVRLVNVLKMVEANPCPTRDIVLDNTYLDYDREDDLYITKIFDRETDEQIHEIRLTQEELLKFEEIVIRDGYVCITDEEYYWRKANQIRGWFEAHLSEPVENCENSIVTKEDLEDLIDTCVKVLGLEGTDYMEMDIKDYDYHNADQKIAEELLPPQSGFFFGSYEYDEWYYDDVLRTLQNMTRILEEVDWENERLYYSEWW